MTTSSPTPAPAPCERPVVDSPATACEELSRLQDVAAARSWAIVDRRRAPRRRHR